MIWLCKQTKKHHAGELREVSPWVENSPLSGRCTVRTCNMSVVDLGGRECHGLIFFSCAKGAWHQETIQCNAICSTNMIYNMFRYVLILDIRNLYYIFRCVLPLELGLPNLSSWVWMSRGVGISRHIIMS